MHFGRSDEASERASEAALIACLCAHEDAAERLYLLGDVFDEYIEYPSLVPKGFVRFQALLAEWTDRGVPVTYLVGNHDLWHRDYFERELGVRVVFNHLVEPLYDHNVYMAHGDGIDPTSRLYNRLRPWLCHPVPVWLYTTLLPGDSGFRLARWVNRRFGEEKIEPARIEGLRDHARHVLAGQPVDVVVMGHSHHPEYYVWPEGRYLNLGGWCLTRTFGRLDDEGLRLLHWNGTCSVEVKADETQETS